MGYKFQNKIRKKGVSKTVKHPVFQVHIHCVPSCQSCHAGWVSNGVSQLLVPIMFSSEEHETRNVGYAMQYERTSTSSHSQSMREGPYAGVEYIMRRKERERVVFIG